MLHSTDDETAQILQNDMSNFTDILPPFASEDNKKLDKEVKTLMRLAVLPKFPSYI